MDGVVKVGPASVRLGYSQMVPSNLRGHVRELASLHVPFKDRRQGHATALMRKVCADADHERKLLILRVEPFDDEEMTATELTDFYARFGFIELQPGVMARQAANG